ncbi:MAG: DsbC family protein [Pseudomonadales bacterium]|jgi:thiol:disulfide interchange protein DsbC|nr:DsbC family protein [Pseudomonadales bacterium]MDP7597410.1 DsbC family protein [Pseudomonadales bacterium]HJN53107.1 DsbC family protein [Pseudomonadales bacterium]|tara:strand:- start:73 stop:789 length:717 start_codon:yes stop_codon:yes gene_type:complete
MGKIVLFVFLTAGLNTAFGEALSLDEVRQKLLSSKPDLPILKVSHSPLEGFYQVTLPAGNILYVTEDVRHFIAGDLYQVNSSHLVNLTETERSTNRKEMIASVNPSEMLIFAPPQTKASVTVFTDVDCSYCRKLHREVPELNRMGIAIRYLAYPRAGIHSASYDKIVSAWCADNPQVALTKAKMGQEIPAKTCDNPVAKQFQLGNELGVTGTPALVLDDGRLLPGYMPAAELAKLLDM